MTTLLQLTEKQALLADLWRELFRLRFDGDLRPLRPTEAALLSVEIQRITGNTLNERSLREYSVAVAENQFEGTNPFPNSLGILLCYVYFLKHRQHLFPRPPGPVERDYFVQYLREFQKNPRLLETAPKSQGHQAQTEPGPLAVWGMIGGFLTATLTTVFMLLLDRERILSELQALRLGVMHRQVGMIFFTQMLSGAIGGWIIGFWLQRYKKWRRPRLNAALMIAAALPLLMALRQLATRNALEAPGFYAEGRGGFLGEPDFEMIGVGLASVLAMLSLFASLRKRPAYTRRDAFVMAVCAGFAGAVAFGAVAVFHVLMVTIGAWQYHDFLHARWLFSFVFPHPERVPLIAVANFIFAYTMLTGLKYRQDEPAQQPGLSGLSTSSTPGRPGARVV